MAGQNHLRSRRVPFHFAWLDQPAWKLSGSVPRAGCGSQRRIALPGEVGLFRIRCDPAVIERHQTGQERMLELPRSECPVEHSFVQFYPELLKFAKETGTIKP